MKNKIKRNIRIARYVIYRETIIDKSDILWTFLGGFFGIGIIGFISSRYFTLNDNLFLIGSFGASAVLIYGATNSPLAQPRNLVGGHVISALVGVTIHKLLPGEVWLSSALAVSTAIVAMQITKTVHPPGGATALIANIGSEKIKALGFMYVLSPVFTGVTILLIIALIFNNIPKNRRYPYKRPRNKILRKLFSKMTVNMRKQAAK
ncbi:MAG TPA: HPP family protein [Bacteroidia bacterium]|nr:HPP family protein [Bacteroidia bacterium]HRG52999.1 HPP family protein [Bacteroidia bacterium]